MKKLLVVLLASIIMLTNGCNRMNVLAGMKHADDVSIYYGLSSYAMFGAEQDVIDDLVDELSKTTYIKTQEKMDLTSTLYINFFNKGNTSRKIMIDKYGIMKSGDDTGYNKITSGLHIYNYVMNLYQTSKAQFSSEQGYESILPVIRITNDKEIFTWSEQPPGSVKAADIVKVIKDDIAEIADSKIYQITPERLWTNQKMQLFGMGFGADATGLGIFGLYMVDHGDMKRFESSGGWVGYLIDSVFLADLNSDGKYEIYTNASLGSGISHDFVQVYDTDSGKFFELSKRMLQDYFFYVFRERLYLIAIPNIASSDSRSYVYKPVLTNNGLSYENVNETLQKTILAEFRK